MTTSQKRETDVIDRIDVIAVKDLGSQVYSVILRVAGGGNEISRTEITSAEDRDSAVEIAKQSFANWLRMAVDVGRNLSANAGPKT